MASRIHAAISLGFVFLLSGCIASTKMALVNDTDTIPKSGKPIYLMTVTLRNNLRTSYQPRLFRVHVTKAMPKEKADYFNFEIDDKAKNETDESVSGNSYLLRMELDPGDYIFQGMTSKTGIFPVWGTFYTPLNERMTSIGTGVFYLGHVDATIRRRVDDEFMAGNLLPLLDQVVIGASNGTFDVEISDSWEKDRPRFLAKFPMLQNVNIQSAILPAFDRAEAQQRWEKYGRKYDGRLLGDEHLFEDSSKKVPRLDATGSIDIEKQSVKDNDYETTNFAKLSNVDAVPKLNARGKEGYRSWLRQKYPRVFVIAADGAWVATWNVFPDDPSESKDPLIRAVQRCRKHDHKDCKPYAINGRVVWPTSVQTTVLLLKN